MDEIKRLNYFTNEFLIARDFIDEQAYHVRMRRQHNRSCHGFGVVEGLEVSVDAGTRNVLVRPGMAIDGLGREVVLVNEAAYTLQTNGSSVYLTIAYQDVRDDVDLSTQEGIDDHVRITERPTIQDSATAPSPGDSAILLGVITLNNDGLIAGTDFTTVPRASAKLAPRSVDIGTLAITKAEDMMSTLQPNTESDEFALSIDSPLPQFLLVSVTPTTLGGRLSFTQTVTRDTSSANDKVTFVVTVKNLSNFEVQFNVHMKTLALA